MAVILRRGPPLYSVFRVPKSPADSSSKKTMVSEELIFPTSDQKTHLKQQLTHQQPTPDDNSLNL